MLADLLFQTFLTDVNIAEELLRLQQIAESDQLPLQELLRLLCSYTLIGQLYTLKHKFEDHSASLRVMKQYR